MKQRDSNDSNETRNRVYQNGNAVTFEGIYTHTHTHTCQAFDRWKTLSGNWAQCNTVSMHLPVKSQTLAFDNSTKGKKILRLLPQKAALFSFFIIIRLRLCLMYYSGFGSFNVGNTKVTEWVREEATLVWMWYLLVDSEWHKTINCCLFRLLCTHRDNCKIYFSLIFAIIR